jgi:predicted RNA-binding protein with PUA-like domain
MRYYLAKTEPSTYSIDDLITEDIAWWDGVHNYAALLVIKSWEIGDKVLIYHSVTQTAIVGLAEVVSLPIKDEEDPRGISWKAKLKFIRKFPPENLVTLKQVKDSGLFTDFALVRQSRLSTMLCPDTFITWLQKKGLDV